MFANGCVYEMLGLRETDLSAVTKVSAGQKLSSNHLNPNVLYMMLCAALYSFQSIWSFSKSIFVVSIFPLSVKECFPSSVAVIVNSFLRASFNSMFSGIKKSLLMQRFIPLPLKGTLG